MLMDFSNPYKANNTAHLRIGLSHMPILISGGYLLRSIIKEIDPDVIFSGHWHESRIFLHPSTTVRNFYESEVIHYNLTALKDAHTYLEIMVPTASYRMGKFHMGIGYATIGMLSCVHFCHLTPKLHYIFSKFRRKKFTLHCTMATQSFRLFNNICLLATIGFDYNNFHQDKGAEFVLCTKKTNHLHKHS